MNILAKLGLMKVSEHDTEMRAKAAGLRDVKETLRKAEEQRDKFRDQVRDTCARAENAEERALAFEKQVLDRADERDDAIDKYKAAITDLAAARDGVALNIAANEKLRFDNSRLAAANSSKESELATLRPIAEKAIAKAARDAAAKRVKRGAVRGGA